MEDISYSIFSFDNQTTLDSTTLMTPNQALLTTMIPRLDAASVLDIISQIFTFSTLWKLLFIILVLGNLKSVPFVWHMRYVNGIRFCLRSQRSKNNPTSAQIFQPLITSSHAPLAEIDFNIHKSNSSYFSDIDICRTHLVCTLFTKGIEFIRGGTEAIVVGSNKPMFGLALGAVNCNFKREIKPYEGYDMWTRVLSWDEKWIYIVTHFVPKNSVPAKSNYLYPEQEAQIREGVGAEKFDPKGGIYASALSKCVFKLGRKTVSPELMLRASGLLPPAASKSSSTHADMQIPLDVKDGGENAWSMERIEEERIRGMSVSSMLTAKGQQALEEEFSADAEILGRHSDGSGITGVISTLAQLAHLKKGQVL